MNTSSPAWLQARLKAFFRADLTGSCWSLSPEGVAVFVRSRGSHDGSAPSEPSGHQGAALGFNEVLVIVSRSKNSV